MSHVQLSAEDRFALVDMEARDSLFAHPFYMGTFAVAARQLQQRWDMLWDFRSVDQLYDDIVDAYEEAASASGDSRTLVLASPENEEALKERLGWGRLREPRPPSQIVPMRAKHLPTQALDLDTLEELAWSVDYSALFPPTRVEGYGEAAIALGIADDVDEVAEYRDELDSIEELMREVEKERRVYDAIVSERAAYLDHFLSGIAANSLMAELAVFVDTHAVHVVPYHAHSLHHVETASDAVLLRPGRVNRSYWTRFRVEIMRLEELLNDPKARERDIEALLLANPLFLSGLNYRSIYPQVVLPRSDGKSLRPDLIAEPADSEWADIIDLKLPTERVLVGREGQASLAAGITRVARQLQEYAAYFDDRRLAREVEIRYGFRCHKPRLVAIVGRDPRRYSAEERRRALTSYPDLEVVTYDVLLRAARQRLLL